MYYIFFQRRTDEEKYEKKFSRRGWMFTDIEIFSALFDIPYKISFITFSPPFSLLFGEEDEEM